ncbi:hypothetical protein KMW28_17570 [Flammeovirga yaeyamensis]|uniref:Uncharacterized protein n=1 Tax=Flammeovirga yaeyamensis TaxID=367791 RepID=A0AAX1N1K4_9BACT|nr:hypothetical protein [Flammeovirga yaeyamensis]MBB3698169.1 hypothetical protein [Flammeovirga yaeyamensis]NMF34474.1 hypothetical protein [Flammeovirga yaeyamensis]QWG01453.1 hypothetical protein KMW28_17570 [Flammeovirga yaeyamensis]
MIHLQHVTFNKLSLVQKAEIVQYFSDFLSTITRLGKKIELYNYDGTYIEVLYKNNTSYDNEIESIMEYDRLLPFCPKIDWKKYLK